jgi:hypothetical protein
VQVYLKKCAQAARIGAIAEEAKAMRVVGENRGGNFYQDITLATEETTKKK